MKDDFYIGYLPKAPAGLAGFVRKTVMALLAGGAVLAALLVGSQQPFYPSVFEFLQYRSFEGVVSERPYPTLLVERPDAVDAQPTYSRYYLVDEGKRGAGAKMAGLDGRRVRLEGALIYRDDQTMIELKPGSVEPLDAAPRPATGRGERSLGTFTLTGEIVDSKCFLGVMNPGSTKPHRGCAVRCISGGVPPVLAVRNPEGVTRYLLLVSAEGRTVNDAVLDRVAEPVEITGEVVQLDDLLILKADPSTYRRVH